MELQSFETDITHNREDFFAFCFSVRGARGHVSSQCKKACAYDVRKAPFRDLLISIHKTRGFEWQTAHTNGCQENRCASRWPKTFIYVQPQFLNCLQDHRRQPIARSGKCVRRAYSRRALEENRCASRWPKTFIYVQPQFLNCLQDHRRQPIARSGKCVRSAYSRRALDCAYALSHRSRSTKTTLFETW